MGVVIGDAPVTKFSYIEYQAMVLCLAGTICVGMLGIEITMNRFQMLPLLFPGVFSVRERRFYFFDVDVSNGQVAGKLRTHAKMLCRMTLVVVLSYLWQHCVMITETTVGTKFPQEQCDNGLDCFASEVHFMTLFTREGNGVDCNSPTKEEFKSRVVVTCIGFIKPTASTFLMHFGIAHSLSTLNLKFYGLLIWAGGNSRWTNRLFALFGFVSLSFAIGLYVSGFFSEAATSWLTFVTTMSVPVFLYHVYRSARILDKLWKEESAKLRDSIEQHLSVALEDVEMSGLAASRENTDHSAPQAGQRGRMMEAMHRMHQRMGFLRGSKPPWGDRQTSGESNIASDGMQGVAPPEKQ